MQNNDEVTWVPIKKHLDEEGQGTCLGCAFRSLEGCNLVAGRLSTPTIKCPVWVPKTDDQEAL